MEITRFVESENTQHQKHPALLSGDRATQSV